MIIATRFGFHGKKGLAGAVTGSETDRERDPRVRFISFPMKECADVSLRDAAFDPTPYRQELEALKQQFGRKLNVLITEPYIGGGGSYHPHKAYLQMLQAFCRENDIIFILDEVQSNFGRTGDLFAFETYEAFENAFTQRALGVLHPPLHLLGLLEQALHVAESTGHRA